MTARAHTMFQGSDWITYRWTVAQVYDSLDCILALSVNQHSGADRLPTAAEMEVLESLSDVCGDLSGELTLATADLSPLLSRQPSLAWSIAETSFSLAAMTKLARPTDDQIVTMEIFEKIYKLAHQIKEKIKKIDA